MKKDFGALVILCILSFQIAPLFAQSDSTHTVDFYFDDAGMSERKNLVKLNIATLVNGDLPFYYERIVGGSFGIEVGVGLLLPYYVPGIIERFTGESEIENPDLGYSLWIQPRFYLFKRAPEFSYFGLQYRQRNYNQEGLTYVYNDVYFNFGLQLVFWDSFLFDYSVGLGMRLKKVKTTNSNIGNGIIMPISLKFGYLF